MIYDDVGQPSVITKSGLTLLSNNADDRLAMALLHKARLCFPRCALPKSLLLLSHEHRHVFQRRSEGVVV